MIRTGWHAREWSEAYFKVLDVAARVGSGVGSYGVPPALLDIPISQRKGVANPSRRRTLTAARDHECRPLFSLP